MLRLRRLGHRLVVGLATTLVVAAVALSALQLLGVFRIVPVLSGSMSGYVETGDAIVLRPVATTDLGEGDVLAFHPPVPGAPLTLHRIVERRDVDGQVAIRTRGDANMTDDPWLAHLVEDTAWRANDVVLPGVGQPVLLLQQPRVRLVWLALTVGTALVVTLRVIWRDEEDDQDEEDERGPAVAPRRPMGRLTAALTVTCLVLVAAVASRHAPGVSATMTASVTASQRIATSETTSPPPPADFTVTLVCTRGRPSGVVATWSDEQTEAARYELLEAPTDTSRPKAVARTAAPATELNHEGIRAVGSGEVWYRLRRVAADGTTSTTAPVRLATTCA